VVKERVVKADGSFFHQNPQILLRGSLVRKVLRSNVWKVRALGKASLCGNSENSVRGAGAASAGFLPLDKCLSGSFVV
jgi:hypothetical protein